MNDKLAICYTCCGPTYRKTAKDKLINLHTDNDNLYYFVITDDKSYFKGIKRKNLFVYELKDFYSEYPHLEKYEYFLDSDSAEDYGKKFNKLKYRFPFSTNRLNLVLAKKHGVTNVALLGTDTDLSIEKFNHIKEKDNRLYNSVGRWYKKTNEKNMPYVVDILKNDYQMNVEENIMIYDAAGKLFCFESVEFMDKFFTIWDEMMVKLYEKDLIKKFQGSYAVNNEYILAPIYDAIGIKAGKTLSGLFVVKHNPKEERFWM